MAGPHKPRSTLYSPTLEESLIPWRTPESWDAAHQTIASLMNLYGDRMAPAGKIASRILSGFAFLAPVFEALCGATCASCPTPCCLTADVRYDFRDLLLMHLTGQDIPDGQPRQTTGDICRYLNELGCALPRHTRPWICTWYLCPEMKQQMRLNVAFEGVNLQESINHIGELRKQLEDIFIRVVAG